MPRGKVRTVVVPVAELTDLYVNRMWCSYQLAEQFNCSAPTILIRLKEAGVAIRKSGNRKGRPRSIDLPVSELITLYVDQLWAVEKIAEEYGCSGPTVSDRLREAGVKIRHQNDTKRGAPSSRRIAPKMPDAAIVFAYQARSNLSISELARVNGCPDAAIKRVLSDHGIPVKPPSQIVVGKRNGIHNPNWRPDLTEDERENRRDSAAHARWRQQVYKRDKFTCLRCHDATGGNLNAHHIVGHSSNVALRWEVSNGATLCVTCHRGFHSRYGLHDNNAAQLAEYFGERRAA